MSEVHRKKKKRSFNQKAKRFGRRGIFGKGQTLSKEEYTYFINMATLLNKLDGIDKDNIIENILCGMVEEEKVKALATSQLVSRILDDILPLASVQHILPIIKVFSDDLRVMCVDPFASHVLQTLLTLSLKYIQKDATHKNRDSSNEGAEEFIPVDQEAKEKFQSFIFKTSRFVYNNLEDFIYETYASHIVRTVLEVCSGVEVSSSIERSSKAQRSHSIKEDSKQVLFVPDSLTSIWHEILDRVRQLPQFSDVISSDCGSTVIQTALLTLSATQDTEKITILVSHILEHGFLQLSDPDEEIHSLFKWNSTCRLMEVIVTVVSQKQQELIYGGFFRKHMLKLVAHELGNFAVQRLFSSWKSREMLPTLLESHSECFEEAFSRGNHGVLFSFAQACKNLGSCQARYINKLMNILEYFEPDNSQVAFGILLMYFVKMSDYEERKRVNDLPPLSLHGTLILQEILHFNKPIKIVKSILEMPIGELVTMMGHPRGSHVTDAFMSSQMVGEASKIKLIHRLEGNFVTLACSKHGSYSLENLWNASNVTMKTKICEELYESSDKLKDSRFGVIIYNKFKVNFFNKNERKHWGELQLKEQKKREFLKRMLQETAEETTLPSPKKKKKKKEK